MLSAALTCHAFLEPALDEIWHSIVLFRPLISCLPTDTWETREEDPRISTNKLNVVVSSALLAFLSRADQVQHMPENGRVLTPDDLKRYLEVYSRRIRSVSLPAIISGHGHTTILSPEFLQALEVATHLQRGTLSPLVTQLDWNPSPYQLLLKTFPSFSLFLGPRTEALRIGIYSNIPTQVDALRFILNYLPPLKALSISNKTSQNSHGDPFVRECGYLTSSSWHNLETLYTSDLPEHLIPCLSTLPRLASLTLYEPKIPLRYTSLPLGEREIRTIPPNGFSSLRTLDITSSFVYAAGFLQRLHPRNQIRDLTLRFDYALDNPDDDISIIEYRNKTQLLVQTIHAHLNSLCLRELDVCDEICEEFEERFESAAQMLDISPLFKFNELRIMKLSLNDGVGLTAAQVPLVHQSWPKIETLELENAFAGGQPHIDHVHFLEIATKCRSLRTLTLSFDASRVGEGDRDSAIAVCTKEGVTPLLQTLYVGHSPIESPSLVISFLIAHFPELKVLHNDRSESDPPTEYEERWQVVSGAISDQ
jgi:hypothetical protein